MTQDKSRTQVAKLGPPISASRLNHPSILRLAGPNWSAVEIELAELVISRRLKADFQIHLSAKSKFGKGEAARA